MAELLSGETPGLPAAEDSAPLEAVEVADLSVPVETPAVPDGMVPPPETLPIFPATRNRDHRWRRFYLAPRFKLLLALIYAFGWTTFSVWIAQGWAADIGAYLTPVGGWIVVVLIAVLPGFVVGLMTMSLVLDRQPPLKLQDPVIPVTVIIAAFNEEAGIAETIQRLAVSDYSGPLPLILANNGSTDATVERALAAAAEAGIELSVVNEPTPGKCFALNTALATVRTPYVITVDADTLVHPQAVRRLMSRLLTGPGHVVAVASTVLVRNSRVNLLTRMQEWDYWVGIAAVKRMQGMYSSTLVAQGAFSVYETAAVREIGGWPDAIGEDIVVTWRIMSEGARVLFEPTAVAFTDVPVDLRHFMLQRSRWARGMFEGLRAVPPWRQKSTRAKLMAGVDLLVPFLDIGYLLLIPGVILWIAGFPLLVSMWTLLVLPVTFLMYGIMRHFQSSRVFAQLGLRVRKNAFAYVCFLVFYQAICSTSSLIGYLQEVTRQNRRWK